MKVLGVDPSSSCCGVAITENKNLLVTDAWLPPKSGSSSDKLVDYYNWLYFFIGNHRPDVAAIEYLSVARNAIGTRVISHYQAISAFTCKKQNLMVIEGRVTSARKISLGKGNLAKKEVFEQMKKKFPNHKFGRWEKPGADETDAVCMALAGIQLAEK